MSFAPLLAAVLVAAPLDHHEEKPPAEPPEAGDVAPDFTLPVLGAEQPAALSKLVEDGPVVALVLRGYPGYQCPICTRQVGAYLREADAFKKAGARVVMIYPGPKAKLDQFAAEFAEDFKLPPGFLFLTDPDYQFTNAYGLRWDAPRETAYPSTFVIAADRTVKYAKVSREHGDRSKPQVALKALESLER